MNTFYCHMNAAQEGVQNVHMNTVEDGHIIFRFCNIPFFLSSFRNVAWSEWKNLERLR